MTQAQAQTKSSILIGLGYTVKVFQDITGDWIINVTGPDISVLTVSNFATAQGITGLINSVRFS